MLQVLIVDDDRLIREEMKLLLDWHKYGFNIQAEADNGVEAMRIIANDSIDIVLTDINMPLMDGVLLIKTAKQGYPQIKFLVMSNFDDFEYVKDAMKYGASEYVLKYKLDEQILLSLFLQLKKTIIQERNEQQMRQQLELISTQGREILIDKFWVDLLDGNYTEASAAAAYQRLQLSERKRNCACILVEIELEADKCIASMKQSLNEESLYWIRRTSQQWVLILCTEEKSYLYVTNQLHAIAQKLITFTEPKSTGQIVVTKGQLCGNLVAVQEQYQKLVQYSASTFYLGNQTILDLTANKMTFGKPTDAILEVHETQILTSLQMGDMMQTKEEIAQLHQMLSAVQFYPDDVRRYLTLLLTQICKAIKANKAAFNSDKMEQSLQYIQSRFSTIKQIFRIIDEWIDSYFISQNEESNRGYRDEIRKAISYMAKHYRVEITLNDVSEHINMSKNHFCKLFKQETGENFVNYLNKIRIDQAKLLILQTNDRIKEIADKVGLGNYRYFCKVFKQQTGLRPLDYKHTSKH